MSRGRHGVARDSSASRAQVERLLEKQQFKDALKQARVNYRQSAEPENRLLFERASVCRAEELVRRSLVAEARDVILQLLEVGVTDEQCVTGLVPLLPSLGLADRMATFTSRLSTPEAQQAVEARLADQAVISPERTPAGELRELALRVRGALDRVQNDDEPGALELLQEIPRSSPLAEWRYLVRGLAAYNRGADDQAVANWDRLTPGRAAHAIAAAHRQLLENAEGDLSKLEVAAFGHSALAGLRRVRQAAEAGDMQQVVRVIPGLRAALTAIGGQLSQRLTEALLQPLSQQAVRCDYYSAQRMVAELTRVAEPLPFDPHWNRMWAVLWEESESERAQAIKYWKAYLNDLAQHPGPLPLPADRMQALVWRHIGLLYDEISDGEVQFGDVSDEEDDDGPRRTEEDRAAHADAVHAMTQSLKLDPTQRETYEELLELHDDWEERDQAVRVARRMLAEFPEEQLALKWLVGHHTHRDEYEQAVAYMRKLRELKPLDEQYRDLESALHCNLARQHALRHQWDKARSAFASAEALGPERQLPFRAAARKALLELKAGNTEAGEALIRDALKMSPQPGPVWLYLSIEGSRYLLPPVELARFYKALKSELGKAPNGATAGAACEIIGTYAATDIEYPDRKKREREVVDYVRRCQKIKLAEADLQNVCVLLNGLEQDWKLRAEFARRGLNQYPKNALFPFFAAQLELHQPPHLARPAVAEELLKQSLAQAEIPGSPFANLVPEIQRLLGTIDDSRRMLGDLRRKMDAEGPFQGSKVQEILDTLAAAFDQDEPESDLPPTTRKARKTR